MRPGLRRGPVFFCRRGKVVNGSVPGASFPGRPASLDSLSPAGRRSELSRQRRCTGGPHDQPCERNSGASMPSRAVRALMTSLWNGVQLRFRTHRPPTAIERTPTRLIAMVRQSTLAFAGKGAPACQGSGSRFKADPA